MKLGDIIKNYRSENRLSMAEFADASGLSKGYVSMLEKDINPRTGGSILPSLETYFAVSKATGIDVNQLLEMVGEYADVEIVPSFSLNEDSAAYSPLSPDKRYLLSRMEHASDDQVAQIRKLVDVILGEDVD